MDVTQQVQEMIFASERSKNACRTYSYTEVKYDIWLGWLKWYAVWENRCHGGFCYSRLSVKIGVFQQRLIFL